MLRCAGIKAAPSPVAPSAVPHSPFNAQTPHPVIPTEAAPPTLIMNPHHPPPRGGTSSNQHSRDAAPWRVQKNRRRGAETRRVLRAEPVREGPRHVAAANITVKKSLRLRVSASKPSAPKGTCLPHCHPDQGAAADPHRETTSSAAARRDLLPIAKNTPHSKAAHQRLHQPNLNSIRRKGAETGSGGAPRHKPCAPVSSTFPGMSPARNVILNAVKDLPFQAAERLLNDGEHVSIVKAPMN